MNKASALAARRWRVNGRVQGVGYRWFVVKCANEIGVKGWVRNEPDGGVQAYAIGSEEQLDRLAGFLHKGPPLSDVRSVEQQEASIEKVTAFEIH